MVVWVVIVVAVIAVVGVGAVAFRVAGAEAVKPTERRYEQPDDMFMFGVILLGARIALVTSVGPAMLGLPVLGAIFMAAGAQRMRRQR